MFSQFFYRKYSGFKNKKIYGDIRALVHHFRIYKNMLKALMSHKPSFVKEFNLEWIFLKMQNLSTSDEEDVEINNANAVESMRVFMTKEFLYHTNCYWKYDREVFYQKKSD
jgi:hypothetical protein